MSAYIGLPDKKSKHLAQLGSPNLKKPPPIINTILNCKPTPSIKYGERIFCCHAYSQHYVSPGPQTTKLKNNSNLPAKSFSFPCENWATGCL